jgi:hypothetical protein
VRKRYNEWSGRPIFFLSRSLLLLFSPFFSPELKRRARVERVARVGAQVGFLRRRFLAARHGQIPERKVRVAVIRVELERLLKREGVAWRVKETETRLTIVTRGWMREVCGNYPPAERLSTARIAFFEADARHAVNCVRVVGLQFEHEAKLPLSAI